MEDCEMCGNSAPVIRVDVDGVIMLLCPRCKKFGKPVSTPKPKTYYQPQVVPHSPVPTPVYRSPSQVRRRTTRETVLIDDYGKIILEARKKHGFKSLRDLAMKIQERESLLVRIEAGKIEPTDTVINKLERELDIKLKIGAVKPVSTAEYKTSQKASRQMTLGDLVTIKKKKDKKED